MNNSFYQILFQKTIDGIKLTNDPPYYIICFIGPPGIGKTTISNILGQKLNIPILSNDKIRRMLENEGISLKENASLISKLSYERFIYMLDKTNMIMDSNAVDAYCKIIDACEKRNVRYFFIKLECSEIEIIRRLEIRAKSFDENNPSRADKGVYYRYKEKTKDFIFPPEKIFFTINTEKNLEKQIEQFILKLKVDKII